jgi:hypothetical protein
MLYNSQDDLKTKTHDINHHVLTDEKNTMTLTQ